MNKKVETFPDGTPIDEWFYDVEIPCLEGVLVTPTMESSLYEQG